MPTRAHRPAWRLDQSIALCKAPRMPEASQAVFLVAQAWGNRTANEHAAVIVRYLFEEHGVRHFFAEGTFEHRTAAELRAVCKDRTHEQMLAGLREGRIQPAEFLAFNSDDAFDVWPADDHGLHDLNLGAYMSLEETERLRSAVVTPLHAHLAAHRAAHLSPDWCEVYDLALSWYDDRHRPEAHTLLTRLYAMADRQGVSITRLPELEAWLLASRGDTAESLAAFNVEMRACVDGLAAKLCEGQLAPEQDLDLLAAQLAREQVHPTDVPQLDDHALNLARERSRLLPWCRLREGFQTVRDFATTGEEDALHRLVLDTATVTGTPLSSLPHLRQRLRTSALMADMKHLRGFQEIFASAITALIGACPDATHLWRMFVFERDLMLLAKLFTMTLDPDGARQAPRLRARYPMKGVVQTVRSYAPPADLVDVCSTWELAWDRSLSRAMRFYRYAIERDALVLDRVRNHLGQHPREDIAIVAGGFHCQLLEPSLTRAGIATVSVAPNVGHLDHDESEKNYRRLEGQDARTLA